MIKVVSINRCEGTGIIERIEGNGWDIDADSIELNGVNARINENLENRTISLNGPAVEDLFKNLRDLVKENGELRKDIDKMKKDNEVVNYCANDVLTTETLYLRQIIEKLKEELRDKDAEIDELNTNLKNHENTQKLIIQRNNELIEKCDFLDKRLKDKDGTIEGKKARIRMLKKELKDKDAEIDELNDELNKKWDFLENRLTVADKLNPILSFISEAAYDNVNFAIKTLTYFIPDYDVTVSVSRKEEKDVEINKPEKYDDMIEIIGWLRGIIENKTDYATKIFNKESKENIFSITFCKVPIEPEVVTNEQD